MGKVFHKLYTIQVKGDSNAEIAIDDMLNSVVEALQSSYPRSRFEGTYHRLTGVRTIMVPLWPVRAPRTKKTEK